MEAVRVAELADAVRQQAPGAPLDRVEAALAVSEPGVYSATSA